MGTVRNGILGSVSGAVGPVVLCTFRDKEVVKTKPKKSTKPLKQSQIDQRSKFKMMTSFLFSIPAAIASGYQSTSNLSTPMNRALKYHLENAITGVSPDFAIDYSKVQLTSVNTASIFDTEVEPAAGKVLEMTWGISEALDLPTRQLRDTDKAIIIFYGENTNMFMDLSGVATRGDGKYTAKFHKMFLGDTIHGWMFFVSADGNTVFKGAYLGEHNLIA